MARLNLRYFAGEGLANMRSHRSMTAAAVGITTACLLLMGTFSLVAWNAHVNLKKLEASNEMVAFVDETYTAEESMALRKSLLNIPNVVSAEYISREEAMEDFREDLPEESYFQDLDPEIFRDRYTVRLENLDEYAETADALRDVDGVAEVRVYEDFAEGFLTIRNVAAAASVGLIAALFLVSVFITANTVRLTTYNRREEIEIMRIVGATNSFIRWPFVYEGLFMGTLAAGLAFALQWGLYTLAANAVNRSSAQMLFQVAPFTEVWPVVAGAFLGAGILAGVGGSLSAIRKFLRF